MTTTHDQEAASSTGRGHGGATPPAALATPEGSRTVIVLCGGCFWGLEYALSTIPGLETAPGYAGGHRTGRERDGSACALKPTYYNLKDTGDAEAVRVVAWTDEQVAAVLREFVAHSRRDPSPATSPRYARRVTCADAAGLRRVSKAMTNLGLGHVPTLGDGFVTAEPKHHGHYMRLYGPPETEERH